MTLSWQAVHELPAFTSRIHMPTFTFPRHALNRLLTSACWVAIAVSMLTSTAQAFDTVVLDPGHGAHDRGAAIGYVYEKHLALDTARRVEQLLKKEGLKVIMSRSRDVFIPLQDRSALGNSKSNAIFVSIHYNYNRGGSGAGAETYYHFSSSYMLAAYIQAYLVQRTSMTNRGVKSANFHVIRATTKNPAVLVECGFVSNSSERARMLTGEFRARIAEGIAQGIVAFKKSK
jgi:N-acetylmuramoyl-L-alanine amidase